MTFANPQLLYALLLVPILALFFVWAGRQRQAALARLGDLKLITRLTANVNTPGRRWKNILWLLALAAAITALARPQWGQEVQAIEQEGLQVVVALDVSQSMLADDIKPNRLERAKWEIADLMDRLDGDEVALVLFSGASFVQVPLTSDYGTAKMYLDNAEPGVISRPGTVIGQAINTAARAFDPELSSQKVLILMTDGEDHETDPLAAAQMAADEGILIYTIGFGTPEGTPIPELDGQGQVVGYKTDDQGQVVLSRLEEGALQEIAAISGGRYFHAGGDGRELDDLLSEIDSLQQAQLERRFETRYIERFQGFLLASLLLLVAAELIPDRLSPRVERSKARRPRLFNRPATGQSS